MLNLSNIPKSGIQLSKSGAQASCRVRATPCIGITFMHLSSAGGLSMLQYPVRSSSSLLTIPD